jgi:HAD superfamily hydrolase (TIGR01509 family)
MPNLELIIFDCDGVLVDSERTSCGCLAAALRQLGMDITTDGVINRFLGLSNDAMRRLVEADLGQPLPDDFLAQLLRSKQRAYQTQLNAIAGVHTVLTQLQQAQIPMCVASSSHPDLIRQCLELTDLIAFFQPHLFSTVAVLHGKPAPDLFLYAANQMHTAPDRCLVIEDSDRGVQAGKAAGMTVLGFAGGSHVDPVLQQQKLLIAGADAVFDQMQQLLDLINTLGYTTFMPSSF